MRRMKKLISVLLVLVMALALCPVTEGYSRDSYDIILDLNEQAAVGAMFAVLESEILNEFSLKDK